MLRIAAPFKRIAPRYAASFMSLILVASMSAPGSAANGREFGILRQARQVVCDYNRTLAEEAVEIYRVKHSRAPRNISELRESFVRQPRCPADGDYVILADGQVRCTVHQRTGPELLTMDVFPSQSPGLPAATPSSTYRRSQGGEVIFLARWQDDGLTHLVEVVWVDPEGHVVKTERPSWQRTPVAKSRLGLGRAGRPASSLPTGLYRVRLRLDNQPVGTCDFQLR